ncbi:MAG: GreA/GreB family elongation factor [Oscillospiraceae bacterium]|nr:GreA/GreB family elongation factor [Oscillospiraceae bacterium]
MHNELTAVDIRKMEEEIEYREQVLMPQIVKDVQTARAFGDLSENYEYKAAKQEQRKNWSRIRYLKQMVASAVVIEDKSGDNEAGLFDTLKIYLEDEEEEMEIRLVTTLRQNPLEGLISKESPLGRALLGRRVGDRVQVQVSESYSYYCRVLAITKGEDDESLNISRF